MKDNLRDYAVVNEPVRKRTFVKSSKPPAGLLLGYARVSKGDEQTNALQARALRTVGCRRVLA